MCRFLPLTKTTPLVTSLTGKHGSSKWSSASVQKHPLLAWATNGMQHRPGQHSQSSMGDPPCSAGMWTKVLPTTLYMPPLFYICSAWVLGGSCSVGWLCSEPAPFSLHEETHRNVNERRRKGFKGCERNSSHPPSLFQDWDIEFCYLVKRKWTIPTKRTLFKSREVVQCV